MQVLPIKIGHLKFSETAVTEMLAEFFMFAMTLVQRLLLLLLLLATTN